MAFFNISFLHESTAYGWLYLYIVNIWYRYILLLTLDSTSDSSAEEDRKEVGRDVEVKKCLAASRFMQRWLRFDQQLRQLEEVAKSQAFIQKEDEREMELGEHGAQVEVERMGTEVQGRAWPPGRAAAPQLTCHPCHPLQEKAMKKLVEMPGPMAAPLQVQLPGPEV